MVLRNDPFEPFTDNGIKDSAVDPSYRRRVIESALLESNRHNIGRRNFAIERICKFRLLSTFIAIVFLLLTGRVFALQIQHGESYRSIAEENRIRIEVIKANRGLISDRNGTWLGRNIPSFSLEAIPGDLPKDLLEQKNLLKTVGEIMGRPHEEWAKALDQIPSSSYQNVTLAEHIDYSTALQIEIQSANWPGIKLTQSSIREYQSGASLGHVLGYLSKITPEERSNNPSAPYLMSDQTGKTGLEAQYEHTLKGKDGVKQIEVNSLGKEQKVIATKEPTHGVNLILSIDLELQRVAEASLASTIEKTKVTGGAAVVMDPRNGQILALASFPSYDPNAFVKGLSQEEYRRLIDDRGKPMFFRAISGEYPSGSTIKPVIGAAALAEGIVTSKTTFLSTGGIRIGQWFFPDWKSGGHGSTNITKAIAESVNTYFYMIGGGDEKFQGLGVEKMTSYAKRFGLAAPLGIDLPNEASGFLPTKEWKERVKGERWYIGDTYHMAIGQGDVLVTPLQVASFTATIANGGTVYQPQLVLSKTDVFGKVLEHVRPKILHDQVVPISAIQPIQQGLRQAVTSGSARPLMTLPVEAAGKTGTAQTGAGEQTHAWFTSYAPYQTPEIVVTVLIEKGGGGHEAAMPVAHDILDAYFKKSISKNEVLSIATNK